jgi:DNA-binding MarR family transcriptional regulator
MESVDQLSYPGSTLIEEAIPDELGVTLLLVRVVDRVKQSIRDVADQMGLSTAQLDVLRQLHSSGPAPMSHLAQVLHCEASNLTGLVDKLEARDLVERRADPEDRRVRVVALTEQGQRATHEAWFAVSRLCPFMNLSRKDKSQLRRMLSAALDQPVEEGSR